MPSASPQQYDPKELAERKKILLGSYYISIAGMGRLNVLPDGNRSGARVIASCAASKQKWRFEYKGSDQYEILWDGKALDASGGRRKNGSPVLIWSRHGKSNQRWYVRREGMFFTIVNVKTGLALDLPGNRRMDGNPMQTYERNGTTAQKFLLRK